MTNSMATIFERTSLRDNLGSFDDELLISLYSKFLDQLAELSTAIAESNRTKNYKTLPFYCHKLIASAASVGAFRLSECLAILKTALATESEELQSIMTITELVINRTSSAVAEELRLLTEGSRYEA